MRWRYVTLLVLFVAATTGKLISIMGNRTSQTLAAVREANAQAGSLQGRQALVVGGTAGIGRGIAQRLARQGASVTVVGRNAERGEKTIASLVAASPAASQASHAFVKGDVSLMQAAQSLAADFADTADRLDFLVMSPCVASIAGFTPTIEGGTLFLKKWLCFVVFVSLSCFVCASYGLF
jgi:hypothetical protein